MARLFTQLHHILACHHDLVIHGCYLSLCNALRRGYSKAFVVFFAIPVSVTLGPCAHDGD